MVFVKSLYTFTSLTSSPEPNFTHSRIWFLEEGSPLHPIKDYNLVWPIGTFSLLEISQHQIIIIPFTCIYYSICICIWYVTKCFYIDCGYCRFTFSRYMLIQVLLNPERGNPTMRNSHRVDTNSTFYTEGIVFLQLTFF